MELSTTVNNNNHRNWVDKDIEGNAFKDKRLQQRFRKLVEQIWNGVGQTIPFACQDWANTKAAYRFLSNDSVSEKEILDGHFNATKERITTLDKGIVKKRAIMTHQMSVSVKKSASPLQYFGYFPITPCFLHIQLKILA